MSIERRVPDEKTRKEAFYWAQLAKRCAQEVLGIKLAAIGVTARDLDSLTSPFSIPEYLRLGAYLTYHQETPFGLDPSVKTIILTLDEVQSRQQEFITEGVPESRALALAVIDLTAEIYTDLYCQSPERKEKAYQEILTGSAQMIH